MLKGLTFLVSPSGVLITLLIGSVVWVVVRRTRLGVRACLTLAGLLAVAAYTPAGFFGLRMLENRFPAWREDGARVDGLVMLDGRIDRLPYDLALARAYPKARVIFSGKPERDYDGFRLLTAGGLEPSRAIDDRRSRDTYQNAVESLALAKPKQGERWLLITSASHMPRAVAVFRAVGFPVIAAPVAYRTRAGPKFGAAASEALSMCDDAFREFWGLIAYRLTGKTRELWPKP